MPDASLYHLADQLYKLAPWKWMPETQLIRLHHPESGELGHISIMGANGEHFCLALYLGEQALHRLNLMQESASAGILLSEEDIMMLVLESRQIQLSFERRPRLQAYELLAAKVRQHPRAGDVECTLQLIASPIGRNPASRTFPYLVGCVDASSRLVLGLECLGVEDLPYEEMMGSVPDRFLRMWDHEGLRPTSIRVQSQASAAILQRTAAALEVPIVLRSRLPALERTLASALQALGLPS